jgi:hypothetical protein
MPPGETAAIIEFLHGIGLDARPGEIDGRTFVPGIQIRHGGIVYDAEQLRHPGDLLHEAGHLAIVPPEKRAAMHIDAGKSAAEEMTAIAWSYAAAMHLGLEAAIVFHEDGYRGGGAALVENFTEGRYVGVPMLQWLGLTADEKRAPELGVPPYPHMLSWLVEA